MKTAKTLITKESIERMNYTDFISLIKETNRCPGGKDTIRKIVQNSFLTEKDLVLDIGSNTGFTSFEVAHLAKCRVEGIDLSKSCINEAKEKLKEDTQFYQKRINFKIGSAYNIPFKDNSFDLVVTGGATSFMEEKGKAVSEYLRVVKPWGFISATQLFYIQKPPSKLLYDVSEAIGVKINPWTEKEWLSIFTEKNKDLELFYYERNALESRDKRTIEEYIDYFMGKPHLVSFPSELQKAVKKKWANYINIFNENHKYLGYFIAIFRKRQYVEEQELFIRKVT